MKTLMRQMWRTRNWQFYVLVTIVFLTNIPDLIAALSNVSLSIPKAVKRGDNVTLIVNYDLEDKTLYSVKWYRGQKEFYRYTPKENPAWKWFTYPNMQVDVARSNATHVMLRQVSLAATSKYTVEVSADAPTFDTVIVFGTMEVVELPTQRPVITGIHSRYRLGDIVNGNCSSDRSKPAANLTWWINEIQVPPNYMRTHQTEKHEDNLESSVIEINFVVTLQHFVKGRLKLKCSARIHDIYAQETEKLLEEDRPRILASGRSPDMNMYPFDHPSDGDQFHDQNDYYLTQHKNLAAAATSLNPQRNLISLHTVSLVLGSAFALLSIKANAADILR